MSSFLHIFLSNFWTFLDWTCSLSCIIFILQIKGKWNIYLYYFICIVYSPLLYRPSDQIGPSKKTLEYIIRSFLSLIFLSLPRLHNSLSLSLTHSSMHGSSAGRGASDDAWGRGTSGGGAGPRAQMDVGRGTLGGGVTTRGPSSGGVVAQGSSGGGAVA
jgi:hypothetical protein